VSCQRAALQPATQPKARCAITRSALDTTPR